MKGFMRKVIFLLFSLIFINVSATNYYVSNMGDDSNDGLSEASAWKTLNKVNTKMSIFNSGDIVAFKGGDEFYGTLNITNKNGIIITSYGSGKAIITGGKIITGWSNIGNNIWEASETSKVHQLFENGEVLSQARYPKIVNDYNPKSNYFQVTSKSSNTVFKCSTLIGLPNIVGASVQIQSADWKFTSVIIKAFNSGTGQITLEKAPSHPIDEGDNFFVINHVNLLDANGEWYYDTGTNKLFIYSILTPKNIVGNTLDGIGIEIEGSDYITIQNISIKYYTEKGINAKSSGNLTVDNSEFLYCYDYGIRTKLSPNATITNNFFKGGMRNAVTFNEWDGTTYPSSSIVSNNIIYEHGIVKQATARNFDISQTIGLHGSGDTMSYNDIQKIGYNGVRIYGSNATIEYNFIKDFCLTSKDGGAIYSQASSFAGTKVDGGIIRNNIIINRDFGYKWGAFGIYNDDRSKNIQVLNNTISDTYSGIFLHNTKNITIDGNNIYNTREVSLTFVEDSRGGEGEMVNNTITNNDVFILKTKVTPLKLRNGNWKHLNFGTFDKNKYWNPYYDKSVKLKIKSSSGQNKTLLEWQNQYEQDAKSKSDNLNWMPQTPETRSIIIYNKEKTQQVKNLSGIWEDLDSKRYNGSITLEPYTSKILILIENFVGTIDANAGDDVSICSGESTTLTANGGTSYSWSTGETTKNITVNPNATTIYTVTVSEEGSSSDTDDVMVTVNDVPVANAGSDKTIDIGQSITLTASGGDNYNWSTGATTKSVTVSPGKTKIYTVTAYKNGCEDTDNVQITVNQNIVTNPPPAKADAGEDQTICIGDVVTITASGGKTYLWSTGDVEKSINVSPTRTTTYTLKATRGGITDTDTVIVTVENCSTIGDINKLNEFNVYPNPTTGTLNVKANSDYDFLNLNIYSINGSIVYSDKVQTNNNIAYKSLNLSNLTKGIYIVRLYNLDYNKTKKIILF